MRRTAARVVGGGLALGCVGLGGVAANDEGVRRSIKFCGLMAPIMAKYTWADVRGASEEETNALHDAEAPRVLQAILKMGGYYVKAAQTCVGSGLLPAAYEEAFQPLLDGCPARPFSEIRRIVEGELGCKVEDVFSRFDEEPLGAASIGQAHRARLASDHGRPVVVKVQYPDVERFFRTDLQTIKLLISATGDFGDKLGDIIDDMAKSFDDEFDFAREADFLREARSNLAKGPYREAAVIPEPVQGLCTRKVLVMDEVQGQPVRGYVKEMIRELALASGQSPEQWLKEAQHELMNDPAKLEEFVRAEGPSEAAMDAAIMALTAWEYLVNFGRVLVGHAPRWSTRPLNGPRLTKTLFGIHGRQIFLDGLFNSDPHAGNIIVQPDGRVGLVDYGAAYRLTREQRAAFADLILALHTGDDDAAVDAFVASGARTKNFDRTFLLAYAKLSFFRGYHPDDMRALGLPADDPAGIEGYLSKIDHWHEFPTHLVLLQRCAMVLQGLAIQVGAGNVSIAALWADQAAAFKRAQAVEAAAADA